jgi:serine/threonine protein kinase
MFIRTEIVKQEAYSFAADIYSFGTVLWELYTRKLPEREMEDIVKGRMLPIPSDCPPEFSTIMKQCWNINPDKRPTFKQTLEMLQFIYDSLTAEEQKKVENEVESAVQRANSQTLLEKSFEDTDEEQQDSDSSKRTF